VLPTMTGHHEVRRWKMPKRNQIMTLPSGWKPFAITPSLDGYGFDVVCRKWVRDEKTTKEEPST
jgi:hypothetical protein